MKLRGKDTAAGVDLNFTVHRALKQGCRHAASSNPHKNAVKKVLNTDPISQMRKLRCKEFKCRAQGPSQGKGNRAWALQVSAAETQTWGHSHRSMPTDLAPHRGTQASRRR